MSDYILATFKDIWTDTGSKIAALLETYPEEGSAIAEETALLVSRLHRLIEDARGDADLSVTRSGLPPLLSPCSAFPWRAAFKNGTGKPHISDQVVNFVDCTHFRHNIDDIDNAISLLDATRRLPSQIDSLVEAASVTSMMADNVEESQSTALNQLDRLDVVPPGHGVSDQVTDKAFDCSTSSDASKLHTHTQGSACQRDRVYLQIQIRSSALQPKDITGLTALFFAIGDGNVLDSVYFSIMKERAQHDRVVEIEGNEAQQILRALDCLDTNDVLSSVFRRYYLTDLVRLRTRLQTENLEAAQRPTMRHLKYGHIKAKRMRVNAGKKQAATKSLCALMARGYPDLNTKWSSPNADLKTNAEYDRKLRLLKTRLSAGRNWALLAEKFSTGILALINIGEHNDLRNADIETLSSEVFQPLLDLLDHHRGYALRAASSHIQTLVNRALVAAPNGYSPSGEMCVATIDEIDSCLRSCSACLQQA